MSTNKECAIFILVICFFLCGTDIHGENSKLRMYGFFDMEAEVSNKDQAGKIWTFDQHHFNLISIYKIDQDFRIYSEVEYEHGPSHNDRDITGKIYLAKAYLEYRYSDALKLKFGKFLTPFGIYNERHDATPTFLTTKLPHVLYGKHELAPGVSGRYYAKISTGIQVLGQIYSNKWEIGYKAFISNGRGAKPSEVDDNPNKGVGVRLTLEPPNIDLKLGASFYSDRNGLSHNARQESFGTDFEIDYGNLHFEGEALWVNLEKYDSSFVLTGTMNREFGNYFLVAYTIKDRLTPMVRYEYQNHGFEYDETERLVLLGLNYAVNERVFFKNEFHIQNLHKGDNSRHIMYVTSIAVAF